MITILLVIVILALIGHILEIDFSNIKKRFKSKEKTSPSGEGYYGAIDRYCETVKKVFGKKENLPKSTEFFIRPKFFGEKDYSPIQYLRLPVNTPSYIVPILVNTPINILEMAGLNKYCWIVDNVFGLSIRGQNVDISNYCTIGDATRTIVFFIGENNKFSLSISFDSGEAIIKTNSKEFALEAAVLIFGAKHIENSNKAYYGKVSLESSRKAKKILEEFENNKIGDDNV